jgi:hypothetical protein
MSKRFLSGINVTGSAALNTVADAGSNTDKFLVLDSSNVVSYRTAAEIYADLGIGSLPAGFTSTLKHEVKASQSISKGQAVYVSSSDGTNMIISKASNVSEGTSSKTMGLLETSLSTNGKGNVITEGLLAGLNTNGATAGDPVWLGVDGALIFGLANKPYAPAHLVFIGIVTRANANNGEIFVKVQNGFEMNELHNYAEGSVQNNQVIVYESATSLYKPKSIPTILGYTPVPESRTLTINGTTYDLSADRSWTVSANQNARTEYEFTTNGSTATYSATYTVGQVDVFYNGSKLSSAEFTATNGTSVTLAFTPPSGQVVEVVAWETGGGVANGRTLTINGTSYDLSADRSWTVTDSSKLPLSGGTLTGALNGTSALFTGNLRTDTGLGLKYGSFVSTAGYLNLFSALVGSTYTLNLKNGTSGYETSLSFNNTANRNYIFPNADGTIALTSDLSSYLPLTGGTLTGLLTAQGGILFNTSQSIGASGTIGFNSTQGLYIYCKTGSAYDFKVYNGVGSTFMQVPTGTQNVEFLGGVTANGLVSTSGYSITSGDAINAAGNLTLYTGANRHIQIGSASNYYWRIRAYNDDLEINGGANAFTAVKFYYPTGAAVFSSSITTNNTITTNKAKAGSGVETNAFLDLVQTGSHAIGDSMLIRFGASGTAYTAQIAGILGADNVAYGSLAFSTRNYFTDSMVEVMRINNRGNVLIGSTTNYGQKLQVNGVLVSINQVIGAYSTTSSTTYGFFNNGVGSLLLTNAGISNVGTYDMSTGVYTALSDINKKKDFEESTIGLKEVLSLKPTLYRMKSKNESVAKELGFIAQEVKMFIPQAYVETGYDENKFIGLNFNAIVAALVKAIQEQQTQIEELKSILN